MAFRTHVSLVICILIQISKPQYTGKLIKGSGESQLSEMNVRLQSLQKTINSFVSDNQQEIQELNSALNNAKRQNTELSSALNNAEKQTEELKTALK